MSVTEEDTWTLTVLGVDPSKADLHAGAASADMAFDEHNLGSPGGLFNAIKQKLGGKKTPKPQHAILGSQQKTRADEKLATLSEQDRKKFDTIKEKIEGKKQQDYLLKSLAAGHSIAEIEAFANKISGKDDKWLQDNLSLTGSSTGAGVQQQWSHSCNATTVEAVKGELDPIYALKMHEDNPNMGQVDDDDATKDNPNLAEDQRSMLESTYHGSAARDHAGKANVRSNTDKTGRGRWANDLMNNMSDVTGLTYETKKVGNDTTTDEAITSIADNTAQGNPVPIVIGNSAGKYTHYVLVTATDAGPPRSFAIHDPWSGKTVTRTEKQMKDGTLDIAGSNQITAFEKPTPVAVK